MTNETNSQTPVSPTQDSTAPGQGRSVLARIQSEVEEEAKEWAGGSANLAASAKCGFDKHTQSFNKCRSRSP